MPADRTRRRILDELGQGDRVVGELVDRLGLSQPAVSKHLRVRTVWNACGRR